MSLLLALTGGSGGYTLTASSGAYSLTGQSATITKATPAVGYTLTAQGGSYTVTGSSAGIVYTPADNFADTHDGYFTNTWLAQWKKKPELAEVVEYVQAHPQEALEEVQRIAPRQVAAIDVAQIDYSTKIAESLAKQILSAISRRQLELQRDEEDAEFLLLMD